MSTGKSPIDLSRIPAPSIVEALDYETIFNAMCSDLLIKDPTLADTIALESEPLTKLLQVCAYRELLMRQRVNEAARAVMLTYAEGNDLENLGALFNVKRLQIDPGDPDAIPPVAPTYESNDDMRQRIQLALDGLSTAGPERAYIYHALSANGLVLDASVDAPRFSIVQVDNTLSEKLPKNALVLRVDYDAGLAQPMPGDVVVTVLSRENNGQPTAAILNDVSNALNAEQVRPLTDHVHTQGAAIVSFNVDATLYTFAGPDTDVVLAESQRNIKSYLIENRRLGRSITRSGIIAALHVSGVQRVELNEPTTDINCLVSQAAFNTKTTLTHGGIMS